MHKRESLHAQTDMMGLQRHPAATTHGARATLRIRPTLCGDDTAWASPYVQRAASAESMSAIVRIQVRASAQLRASPALKVTMCHPRDSGRVLT